MNGTKGKGKRMYRGVVIPEEDHAEVLERESLDLPEAQGERPPKTQFYRGTPLHGESDSQDKSPNDAHSYQGSVTQNKPLPTENDKKFTDTLEKFRASIEKLKRLNSVDITS